MQNSKSVRTSTNNGSYRRRIVSVVAIFILLFYLSYVYSNIELFSFNSEKSKLLFELNRLKAENMRLRAYFRTIQETNSTSTDKLLEVADVETRNILEGIFSNQDRPVKGVLTKENISSFQDEDFVNKYVDVLRGCKMVNGNDASRGNIYPIVSRPWGMNRWSITSGGRRAPWFFTMTTLTFSNIRCTHQPSPWIGDYSYFTISPFESDGVGVSRYPRQFLNYKNQEFKAHKVYLELTKGQEKKFTVEFTGTKHGGLIRIEYLGEVTRGVSFENAREFDGKIIGGNEVFITFTTKNIRGRGIPFPVRGEMPLFVTAYCRLQGPPKNIVFSQSSMMWENSHVMELVIGTSYISYEQAQLNMEREVKPYTLMDLVENGKTEWNQILGRVKVKGGYPDEKTMLYTALYRAAIFPSRLEEVGKDGSILHRSPYDPRHEVFAGPLSTDSGFWDSYRTVYPMLHLIYPEIAENVLQGWVNAIREDPDHMLAQWAAPGRVGSMVGSMGEVSIAEGIVNGAIKEPYLQDAFEYIKTSSTKAMKNGREHMNDYFKYGYIPAHFHDSVSLTLNYKLADFAVSKAAKFLGDFVLSRTLYHRSLEWRKLFNPDNLFLNAKDINGRFKRLDPYRWMQDYTEGCAWHYRFYVPHDPQGLRAAYQGSIPEKEGVDSVMCRELKQMMINPNTVSGGVKIHEQREMREHSFGQYAHNNQPVHHVLYMFSHAGCPIDGQKYIFKTLKTQYGKFGYAGDEDNGEMSSWFVLSALGLYALAPGNGMYQVGAPPLFKEVLITRPDNHYLHIARDFERETEKEFRMASAVSWRNWKKSIVSNFTVEIPYTELRTGGMLLFHQN